MKEGDIVVINAAPDILIHAKLNRPLVSGWVVELVCDNGVQYMRETGHPAFHGYLFWAHSTKIDYEYKLDDKESKSCDEKCVLEEESELYKTYGGDQSEPKIKESVYMENIVFQRCKCNKLFISW